MHFNILTALALTYPVALVPLSLYLCVFVFSPNIRNLNEKVKVACEAQKVGKYFAVSKHFANFA